MSEIKLKPCPFCGKELIINKGYYAHELSLTEPIECYAATWVFRVDDEKNIELWNTRKTMDDLEIVHCKDCIHWGTGVPGETENVKCCEHGKYMVGKNGYCVYGEKECAE